MADKFGPIRAVIAVLLACIWLLAIVAMSHFQERTASLFASQQFSATGNLANVLAQTLNDRLGQLREIAAHLPPGWSVNGLLDKTLLASQGMVFEGRLQLLAWQGGVLASTPAWDADALLIGNDLLAEVRSQPEGVIDFIPAQYTDGVKRIIFAVQVSDRGRDNAGILLATASTECSRRLAGPEMAPWRSWWFLPAIKP